MATYSVFVEGPIDSMGLPELASAMSQRYGLPAAELVTRLQRGRFRVKSNLDAQTAERYRRDLEKIGARVVVEDTALSPTATPAVGLPIQAALQSTLPGPMQGRAPALSLPPVVAQQAAEATPSKDPRTFTILGPQHTREPGRAATASEAPPVGEVVRTTSEDEAAVRREVIRAGITSEPARRPGTVTDASNRVVRPSSANDASGVRRPGTSSSAPQQIREVVRPGRVSTPQGLREPPASARPPTASTPQGFREVMRPGSVSASPDVFRTGAQPTVQPRSGPASVLPPRDPAQPSVPPPSVLPPRSGQPSIPPQSALPPREASPSMPPPANGLAAAAGQAARPAPQLASGLAAAYTPASGLADLGALAESSFSLASLDGQDDVPAAALPPEAPAAIVSIKPKVSDAPRAKPSPSKPMDLFAPPDAGDQELKVELAVEEIAERAAKRASIPPATQQLTAAASQLPSQRFGMAQPVPLPAPSPSEGGTAAVAKPFSREQFAIGVVLALVIGFVPAHFVASAREKTAFAAIDSRVDAMQAGADTPESYALLDGARLKFRNEKESTRGSLALQSMLIWAVVSAGVGFAFFKLRKPS